MRVPQRLREWARSSPGAARAIRVIDALLAPILLVGLMVARVLRVLGLHRTPIARRLVDLTGVLPVHDHYYQPLVRPRRLARHGDRVLPGVDMRWESQGRLLGELARHAVEFRTWAGTGEFDPDNGFYGRTDASVLYGMLRHLRPHHVIEVGSGHSTRVAIEALARNAEDGVECHHLCIEPYENAWLDSLPVAVLRTPVEELPATTFGVLGPGDVLFIDSSHMIRPGGDVLHLLLRVLPSLAPGVVIHVHDVFTPDDYPEDWLVRLRRLWNEQYLVEALLSGGDRFRVELAVSALWKREPAALRMVGAEGAGAAFWIRRDA